MLKIKLIKKEIEQWLKEITWYFTIEHYDELVDLYDELLESTDDSKFDLKAYEYLLNLVSFSDAQLALIRETDMRLLHYSDNYSVQDQIWEAFEIQMTNLQKLKK